MEIGGVVKMGNNIACDFCRKLQYYKDFKENFFTSGKKYGTLCNFCKKTLFIQLGEKFGCNIFFSKLNK